MTEIGLYFSKPIPKWALQCTFPNGLQKPLEGSGRYSTGSIICSQTDYLHCAFISHLNSGYSSSQSRRQAPETEHLLLNGDEWSSISMVVHQPGISYTLISHLSWDYRVNIQYTHHLGITFQVKDILNLVNSSLHPISIEFDIIKGYKL